MNIARTDYMRDGAWIMARAGGVYNPGTDRCFALCNEQGETLGGAVFTRFLGNSVAIHIAGNETGWCTRRFIGMVFHFAFEALGCGKLIAFVSSSNRRAISVVLRMGFRLEARLTEAYDKDQDLLVLTMAREGCKWLELVSQFDQLLKQHVTDVY